MKSLNKNLKSFYIFHLLINFLLKSGKKNKLTKLMFFNFFKLVKLYQIPLNYILLLIFYIWRPVLEIRTISTKTQNYTIGVPIKEHRMFYILFKTHFLSLKKKKKKQFNEQLNIILINLFKNKYTLLLPNVTTFNEAYKNRAFLHFRKYINC